MRKSQPIVRGERCPATRTSKVYDPKVADIRHISRTSQAGKRPCGRCGNIATVKQAIKEGTGAPLQSWYYERHNA